MTNKTTTEISENLELWQEYVDPDSTMSEAEFEELSTAQKNIMQFEMFPDEVTCNKNGIEI